MTAGDLSEMGVDSSGGGPERKCRVTLHGLVDRMSGIINPGSVSAAWCWGGEGRQPVIHTGGGNTTRCFYAESVRNYSCGNGNEMLKAEIAFVICRICFYIFRI